MKDGRRVAQSGGSETPNNSQLTNFIMNEYVPGGPDEMQFPRAMEYKTSKGEKAVSDIRMPY